MQFVVAIVAVTLAGCDLLFSIDPVADANRDGQPPSDAACTFGPWAIPTKMTASMAGVDDREPALAPDASYVVFASDGAASVDLFVAMRQGDNFVGRTLVASSPAFEDSAPAFSGNGTVLYWDQAGKKMKAAVNGDGTFGAAAIASEVDALGRRLRFTVDDLQAIYSVSGDLALSKRTRSDMFWPAGTPIPELATASNEDGATLSADGLTLYFSTDHTGSRHLSSAQRATTDAEFQAPLDLGDLAEANPQSFDLSRDGRMLVFAAFPSDSDIFVTTRSCVE